MNRHRILIAGIGNIFLGDDAFGCEVAERLRRCPLPAEVRVADFGIRSLDLTYALLEDYEAVVLIDAAPRGGEPGTLYVIEPDLNTDTANGHGSLAVETHGMDPVKVLRLAAELGSSVRQILLVGCEPARSPDAEANDEQMSRGLSDAVRAAVDEAVALVESLVQRLIASHAEAADHGLAEGGPTIQARFADVSAHAKSAPLS